VDLAARYRGEIDFAGVHTEGIRHISALDIDYAGEEVTIGFNARYVLEALTPVESEQVILEFKDGLSPGVVRGVENEGYRCVIMPMRI